MQQASVKPADRARTTSFRVAPDNHWQGVLVPLGQQRLHPVVYRAGLAEPRGPIDDRALKLAVDPQGQLIYHPLDWGRVERIVARDQGMVTGKVFRNQRYRRKSLGHHVLAFGKLRG